MKRIAPTILSGLATLLGVLVIIGWYTKTVGLIQVLPHLVPMQYNTALLMTLSGLSVIAHLYNFRIPSGIIGAFVAIVGTLTLLQYGTGADFGIDQLIQKHYITTRSLHPGRMAPNTALCFVFMGLGVLILSFHTFRITKWITSILAVLATSFGFVSIFGYLINLREAYGWGSLTDMALHTSIGFILLGLALYLTSFTYNAQGKAHKWVIIPLFAGTFAISVMLFRAMEVARMQALLEQREYTLDLYVLIAILLMFMASVYILQFTIKQSVGLSEAIEDAKIINEEKTKILHYVSHEVRNPLNVIVGYSEALGVEDDPAEMKMRLSSIFTSAMNIKSIVDDLLSWATIDSGKISLDLKSENLNTWIDELEQLLAVKFQETKLNFKLEKISPLPETFVCDRSKLQEIISNLVDNAIKNIESDQSVTVRVQRTDHNIEFLVIDTGKGISEEEMNLIFLPFTQAKDVNNERGLGLGLAICKRFIKSMNGSIRVESQVGTGSTFICTIPIADTEEK